MATSGSHRKNRAASIGPKDLAVAFSLRLRPFAAARSKAGGEKPPIGENQGEKIINNSEAGPPVHFLTMYPNELRDKQLSCASTVTRNSVLWLVTTNGEVPFMVISKIVAAAGLAVAIGAFAPCAFAQAGGGAAGAARGGVVSGAPAASGGGMMTNQAPSAGQPGTQAPASAAPVGSASSDYMSSETANGPQNSSVSGPSAQNEETRARRLETKVERDIGAARSNGVNVAKATHQKWLGVRRHPKVTGRTLRTISTLLSAIYEQRATV